VGQVGVGGFHPGFLGQHRIVDINELYRVFLGDPPRDLARDQGLNGNGRRNAAAVIACAHRNIGPQIAVVGSV